MQSEMDNNDNPIIQGLEALLGGEDVVETAQSKSFEEMRTRFKESFSLDQSKDSGIIFGNSSSRLIHSVNSSIQNQSAESGFSFDGFDNPFALKQSVKNVSFDGCFIEDDFSPLAGDFNSQTRPTKYTGAWNAAPQSGILSSAISHGGDLKKVLPTVKVQEAYTLVKFHHMMKKCWSSLNCIRRLRSQLSQKQVDVLDSPSAWNLKTLMDAFQNETVQATKEFNNSRLIPVLLEIQNSFELLSTNITGYANDFKALTQLQRLVSNLFVAMYCLCVLQHTHSTPSEEKFRSEKRFQIWNSFA